jgi:hypothetical protein
VTEQRYKAVLAVIAERRTVTQVARDWNVARQTVHVWLERSGYPHRVSSPLLPLGHDMLSRDRFLVSLRSWSNWPRDLDLPSEHFCLLLVGDATGASDEAIGNLAGAAIDAGCVFLCAWGPDCDRVHCLFDEALVDRDLAGVLPDALSVMTTSHAEETLDDAIQFLSTAAWPADPFVDTCRCALIAVVGDTDWVASIAQQLGS